MCRRAWLLWFHCKSTAEKISLTLPLSTSYVSSEVLKCRWYLKNRHYASDAFLLKLYLTKTLVELAVVWSNLVAHPSLASRIRSSDEIVCDVNGYTTWCYMLVIFYNAALCIYAALHFGRFLHFSTIVCARHPLVASYLNTICMHCLATRMRSPDEIVCDVNGCTTCCYSAADVLQCYPLHVCGTIRLKIFYKRTFRGLELVTISQPCFAT